jgi:hypothetical protein
MSRRSLVRAALGALLLALAVAAVVVAHGTAEAAAAFRHNQAEWQRGVKPMTQASPGLAQRTGETLLGIGVRSDVLRAYERYRAGLADVIPGTTHPQTRARFELAQTLRGLRGALRDGRDRAAVDVVLAVVLADDAAAAGPQRRAQLDSAVATLVRAATEDPASVTARLDLEVLLHALTPRSRPRPTPSGSATKQRQPNQSPSTPTAPAKAEGHGF